MTFYLFLFSDQSPAADPMADLSALLSELTVEQKSKLRAALQLLEALCFFKGCSSDFLYMLFFWCIA